MGLIECRSGKLAEGIGWLRRASDAEPDNVGYRVMLARALVDSGKADEALHFANPQSATGPAELALWHARAEAADSAGKPDVAAENAPILGAMWSLKMLTSRSIITISHKPGPSRR